MTKEEIKTEINRLDIQQQICFDAFNEYIANHKSKFTAEEVERLDKVLKRMFLAEKEYLQDSPDDYFTIYKDEISA